MKPLQRGCEDQVLFAGLPWKTLGWLCLAPCQEIKHCGRGEE